MRTAKLFLVSFLALAAPAWAQQAFTNRATDLKEQASADSRTVESLRANTELKVVSRGSGWTKVESGGKTGWVNVFHLRFPASATTESSGGGLLSGLSSAIGGRPKSQQAGIQTVGVRGLSAEELKSAAPDAQAVQRMQSFKADKGSAERFAREGKLAEVQVDYNEGSRR